jgi:hypothetical protein
MLEGFALQRLPLAVTIARSLVTIARSVHNKVSECRVDSCRSGHGLQVVPDFGCCHTIRGVMKLYFHVVHWSSCSPIHLGLLHHTYYLRNCSVL